MTIEITGTTECIPWLNSGEVNQWVINKPSAFITEEAFRNSSAKWIPKDALVMALAGQGKTKGMVAQLGIESTCNQSMAAIVPARKVNPRFLLWWLSANYETIRNLAGGEQRDGLNLEIVGDIPCPNPAPEVQLAIADYLDRETARLDALVAAKERVLGLLAEKRRALITRAVTRGLDPRAPLRDSGIPWLGEIPAHWRSMRLRFVIRNLEQGWSPEAENREPNDDEWGVLKLNAVSRGRFDPSAAKALPVGFEVRAALEVHPGDFLVTRSNTPSFVGDVCFVTETRPRLMLSDLIYRLTLVEDRIAGSFLSHFFTLPEGRTQIQADARGTSNSMVKISQEHIKDWVVPMPPMDEQNVIVAHVTIETAKLDALRAATERTIALLKERRAALIAAAVTGQIDVQGNPARV